MKKGTFFKNAALVAVGGFLAKGMGGLYRIPLANLVGGYGMGLYQMAYPLFCVLLTFSSAGIPAALSRIVAREYARGKDRPETVKTALALFLSLGFVGTLLMALLAPVMGAVQGEEGLYGCYLALAPSVFLVSAIAVYRGYFQGKNNVVPTVLSELCEQGVKGAFGLLFCLLFRGNPVRQAQSALFAVTLSELVSAGYLHLRYRGEKRGIFLRNRIGVSGGEIAKSALPVMLSAAILPLSQTADSVLLVRLMASYTPRAVTLYGLYTGGALSLINLPASVCYGIAVAIVPVLSGASDSARKERAVVALLLTLALSLPCAAVLFLFAEKIVAVLYAALPLADGELLVRLIRATAVSAATLSCVQTLSACLTGMGRAKYGALSMAISVALKFALEWWLVSNSAHSVLGAAIATNVCYLVAFFLLLGYTLSAKSLRKGEYDHNRQPWGRKKRLDGPRKGSGAFGGQSGASDGAYRIRANVDGGERSLRNAGRGIRKKS